MENFIKIGDKMYARVQSMKYYNCAFYQGKCKREGFIFKPIREDANVKLKFRVSDNKFNLNYLTFSRGDCLRRFSIKGLLSKETKEPVKLDSFQVSRDVMLLVAGYKIHVPKDSHIIITEKSMYAISDELFKEMYIREGVRNYVPKY